MRATPASLLLFSLAALAQLAQQTEARQPGLGRAHWQHYASRNKETWQTADNWCRGAGLGGLMPATERSSDLLRHMRNGFCYWVRPSEAILGSHHHRRPEDSIDRCLCLSPSVDSEDLRLHRVSCRHRRRFLCLRGQPVDELKPHMPTKTSATTKTSSKVTTKTPSVVASGKNKAADPEPAEGDDADVSTGDEDHGLPGDETVDHAKFPVIRMQPDGHAVGWLPPWGVTPRKADQASTTGSEAAASTVAPMIEDTIDAHRNASSASDGPLSTLQAMIRDQNSEFITLLVLYTIVGVTLMVLLTLCLVRCCRGYCGKAKIRYVKQVDADDIPRFMPSSWA